MRKTFIHTAFILFLCIGVWAPRISSAQVDLPFGGLVVLPIPCVCSFGMAITFAPMYPNPPFPFSGALHFVPGTSFLHPNYLIGVTSKWHLGKYFPTPGTCWTGVPPACVPFPTWGVITRVGTSG